MHEGEDPEVGLKREMREELNLEIEVGPVLTTWPVVTMKGNWLFMVVHKCQLADGLGSLKPQKGEVFGVKWVSRKDYKRVKIYPEFMRALDFYFQ